MIVTTCQFIDFDRQIIELVKLVTIVEGDYYAKM